MINLKDQLIWRVNILLTAISNLERSPLYRGGHVAIKVSGEEPKPGKQCPGHTNCSLLRRGKEFSELTTFSPLNNDRPQLVPSVCQWSDSEMECVLLWAPSCLVLSFQVRELESDRSWMGIHLPTLKFVQISELKLRQPQDILEMNKMSKSITWR